jgi:hypothetical protein
VVPLYWLGREFFDRRVCFWAVLLFQALPASGRVLGDGLSESFFLLCAAAGLLFACRALRRGSWPGLAAAGLLGGLAYLTRPEGGLLVAATGLVLFGLQFRPRFRTGWGRFLARAACLSAPALAVAVPYMLTIGGLTAKMAAVNIIYYSSREQPAEPVLASRPASVVDPPLAVWWGDKDHSGRFVWAVRSLARVLARAFFYVLWVPTLIGLWRFRARLTRLPGAWVLLLVNLGLVAALFRVTVVMGYVSERHLLLLVLCYIFWTAAGLDLLAGQLVGWLSRGWPALAGTRWGDGRSWAVVVLLAATAVPLIKKSLEPLHGGRSGFRTAGYWLAEHSSPDERLIDPFGWTYYYSGRTFHEPMPGTLPVGEVPPRYVVIDETGNEHPHLLGYPLAKKLIEEGHAQLLQSWDLAGGKVVLYRLLWPAKAGMREPRFGEAWLTHVPARLSQGGV